MKHLIFENYRTDTYLHLSDFWKLFWKTLSLRPSNIVSLFANKIKQGFYKLRYGKHLSFGKKNYFIGKFRIDMLEQNPKHSHIKFGDGVLVRDENIKNHFEVLHNGKIDIGNNVFLNGVFIYSFEKVSIGNNVMIGWGSEILDTDAHPIDKQHPVESAPVIIKNNVWISNHVSILKGVTIGTGSVIGARSVVVKNVKAHSFYAGNPAKFIHKIGIR